MSNSNFRSGFLLAVLLTGSLLMGAANTEETSPANDVLNHHLGAFAEGVDSLVSDYTEESVIFTHNGTFRGLQEIRGFFENFTSTAPEGFWEAFKLTKQEVTDEVAYIVWEAKPWIPLATDTMLVRDGKIAVHTFASYNE